MTILIPFCFIHWDLTTAPSALGRSTRGTSARAPRRLHYTAARSHAVCSIRKRGANGVVPVTFWRDEAGTCPSFLDRLVGERNDACILGLRSDQSLRRSACVFKEPINLVQYQRSVYI